MLPSNNTSHPICALFIFFLVFCCYCFSPEMSDIFGGGAVGVFVKGDCYFPYLLLTKSTHICITWSSVIHFRHARRCKGEPQPPSMKMDMLWQLYYDIWTLTICFQKIVLYFLCTGHCMHFLKCMVPLPLNSSISFPPASSNQLWSPAHCPHSSNIGLHAKTQPNICDFGVFVDSIMCKTVLHTF